MVATATLAAFFAATAALANNGNGWGQCQGEGQAQGNNNGNGPPAPAPAPTPAPIPVSQLTLTPLSGPSGDQCVHTFDNCREQSSLVPLSATGEESRKAAEPGSIALFGMALAALAAVRRRRAGG